MNVVVGRVELNLGFDRRNQRPAVTGADRIDEHQVGEIQPRTRIVGQLRRIRRAVSLHAELEVLGADGAEIQKDGGRARTAIQRERDRPVLALHGVRGQDHLRNLLAVVVDRQRAHGDRVVQRLAIELNALRHMRVGGQRSFLVGGFYPCPSLSAGAGGGAGLVSWAPAKEEPKASRSAASMPAPALSRTERSEMGLMWLQ